MNSINHSKPKVLCVIDHPHWISAKIAREIKRTSRHHEITICSIETLLKLRPQLNSLDATFDLIHCLTPHLYPRIREYFHPNQSFVCHVHHLEDDQHFETIKQMKLIATVCKQCEKQLRSHEIETSKLMRLANGISTSEFPEPNPKSKENSRKVFKISSDSKVIGFIGKASSNSNQRKGIDTFTECIKLINKSITNLVAFIVGQGWEELIIDLKKSGVKVIHKDYLPTAKSLRNFYESLDLYLITARIEGGPVPLLESMACARPVIATRVGIAEEIIKDGENGFLIDFDNTQATAKKCIECLTTANLQRMGQMARHQIKQSYEWDQTLQHIDTFYSRALTSPRKSNHYNTPLGQVFSSFDQLALSRHYASCSLYKHALKHLLISATNISQHPKFYQLFFSEILNNRLINYLAKKQ